MQPPGGSRVYSPYVDVTLAAPFQLATVADDGGARSLTLAFVTADAGGCQPAWGGQTPILAAPVVQAASRLRAAGVALRISFGGARGQELAAACGGAGAGAIDRLASAYASVLDPYHAVAADFDLEGTALLHPATATVALRAAAIARLQAQDPRVAVTVSLPVSPGGLSPAALAAVRAMLAAGVRPRSVNLLAMDYGAAADGRDMGAETILALRAAHRQLGQLAAALSPWSALGVTVMVGVNDISGEVLTLNDARAVATFATRHGLGLTSIWSLARDNPCPGSGAAAEPTCSGVVEPPYAFSRAFGANSKTGVPERLAVDTS